MSLPPRLPKGVVFAVRAVGAHPISSKNWQHLATEYYYGWILLIITVWRSGAMGNSGIGSQASDISMTINHPRIKEVRFADKNEIMRTSIAVDSQ